MPQSSASPTTSRVNARLLWRSSSIFRWPFRLFRMSWEHSVTWTTSCSRKATPDLPEPSTSPPSSWLRRTSAACRPNTTARPRSSSCWGRRWRRWSWGLRHRSRRWVPGTSPSRSCWRCCRAKGSPRWPVEPRTRRSRTGRDESQRLRLSSATSRSYWTRRRKRTFTWERYAHLTQVCDHVPVVKENNYLRQVCRWV